MLDIVFVRFLARQGFRQNLCSLGAITMSGAKSACEIPCSMCFICSLPLPPASTCFSSCCRCAKRMFGTFLTMWKIFSQEVEKLAEIRSALGSPKLKIQKPSDTRWLARERCVRCVRAVRSCQPWWRCMTRVVTLRLKATKSVACLYKQKQ